jgi:hypothetical protein
MPQSNFIPRRKRSRGVNSVLHIFCEGSTEEAYFEAYKRKIHCAAVVIEHSHHGDPKGLVAEAIKAKEGSPANDIFWVVYDAEELSQRNKLRSHSEAFQAANRNGINIAFSAICFEVWLLLHFIPNPSMFLQPSKAVKELQKYIKNYKKGDLNILTTLLDKLSAARLNAASLAQRQQRNNPDVPMYEYNPYTTVHLLLDAIDGMLK